MKLFILPLLIIFIMAPAGINSGPTPQARAEHLIRGFLVTKGSYMALYFSDIDTAFKTVEEEKAFQELSSRVKAYQDSTEMFSRIDITKANFYYNTYKKLNLQKDSMRIHYDPQPLGYLMIHHFQLAGDPWTDSFILDFNISNILKIKETIE